MLAGQSIGRDDFEGILRDGFSQTLFNGLEIGERFEFRSEDDNRTLVMQVEEVTHYADGRPCLSISKVVSETSRQHQRRKLK